MGNAAGAIKTAAKRVGVPVQEYAARVSAGEKWCSGCKAWHPRSMFAADRHRADGLVAACRAFLNERARQKYVPKVRPVGRRYVEARDDDRKQARRRVNHLVAVFVLPFPGNVPCTDCGHADFDRRHEYDHYLGYAPEHHEDVEVVCSLCHHARERARATTREVEA